METAREMTRKSNVYLAPFTMFAVIGLAAGLSADVKAGERPSYGYAPNDTELSSVLHNMLQYYDSRLRPNYTGAPTKVWVDFSILSFGHIQEVEMIFPVDMFFRQVWYDHRLTHHLNSSLVLMLGRRHPADLIWVPDTVFINAVVSRMHHVTVANNKLDIYPDGKVFWGTRATVMASCRLDLRSYPMDTQSCELGVESYAYPADHIMYAWRVNPGIKILDREMSQYQMTDYKTQTELIEYVAGRYSILKASFTFKRRTGHAIIQIYVPTIAIVIVSWVSLWIHKDSTAARIGLCVTTLLTLATIWGAVNSTLPRVSYIKAVDIYFMVSFCFVFCTLVEYTLVLNIGASKKKRRKLKRDAARRGNATYNGILMDNGSAYPDTHNDCRPLAETTFTKGLSGWQSASPSRDLTHSINPIGFRPTRLKFNYNKGNLDVESQVLEEKEKKDSSRPTELSKGETSSIDVIGRVAFPVGFALFNLFYWMKFLGQDSNKN